MNRFGFCNKTLFPRLVASPLWRRAGDDARHAMYRRWFAAVRRDQAEREAFRLAYPDLVAVG